MFVWGLGRDDDDDLDGEEDKKFAEAKKRAAEMTVKERLMMMLQVSTPESSLSLPT